MYGYINLSNRPSSALYFPTSGLESQNQKSRKISEWNQSVLLLCCRNLLLMLLVHLARQRARWGVYTRTKNLLLMLLFHLARSCARWRAKRVQRSEIVLCQSDIFPKLSSWLINSPRNIPYRLPPPNSCVHLDFSGFYCSCTLIHPVPSDRTDTLTHTTLSEPSTES